MEYAIREKRAKEDRFQIITLVLDESAEVPELLRPFVWKSPTSPLEALRETVRALPIRVGSVSWK